MDMRERIQQANNASYAAWNGHDPDGIAAIFAPHGEIIDITSGITTRGRDAIRTVAVDRLTGFPDFSLECRMSLIDGNSNSDQWIMRATHTGEYMGLEPTGRPIEVCGATFSEFNDDALVVRHTHYIDVPALLRQLGLD
jgi:predicted ester cyclase